METVIVSDVPGYPGRVFVSCDKVPKLEVHVLSKQVHEQLRTKFPALAVSNDTSPMQAGYQLGVAKVLDVLLREGFLLDVS